MDAAANPLMTDERPEAEIPEREASRVTLPDWPAVRE
jgi:hypothetical protein